VDVVGEATGRRRWMRPILDILVARRANWGGCGGKWTRRSDSTFLNNSSLLASSVAVFPKLEDGDVMELFDRA
jgi:hypothetical protein